VAQLTVIYWRDIPAQVILRFGRTSAKRELPARFQEAIDRAAMRGGGRAGRGGAGDEPHEPGPKPKLSGHLVDFYLSRILRFRGQADGVVLPVPW
jgi:hypothetical protein